MSWSEVNFLDKKMKELTSKVATIYSNLNTLTTKVNSIEQKAVNIRKYNSYQELPNLTFKILDTGVVQRDTVSDMPLKTLLDISGKGYLCYCYFNYKSMSHYGKSDLKLKISVDGVPKLWVEVTDMSVSQHSIDMFGIMPNITNFNEILYGDKTIGLYIRNGSTTTNIKSVLNYSSSKQVFKKAINTSSYLYKVESVGIRFERTLKIEANCDTYNVLYSLD